MNRLCVIYLILLVFYFCFISTKCGVVIVTAITNDSSISFENPQLVIGLQFDTAVPGPLLNLEGFVLSNSPAFDTSCTFSYLNLTIEGQVSSDLQNLTLSLDNSTAIITERSTGGTVCLQSPASSFLQVPDSEGGIALTSTFASLRVIENTTPPSISNVIVDLILGNISIMFDEFVDLETLNPSLLSLSSFSSNPLSFVAFNTLTNYNSATGVDTVYVISLEVFELAIIGNVCVSNCTLYIGIGSLVSDLAGNSLTFQIETMQSTTFYSYSPFQFRPSFSLQNINPTTVNVIIDSPLSQYGVVNYGVYIFPLSATFYHGNCQYPSAYEFQKNSTTTRWNSDPPGYQPCINGTDYMCYSTPELTLTVDLFPGYSMVINVVAFYTEINFTSTTFLSPIPIYTNSLGVHVFTEPTRRRRGNGLPPVNGNQVLVMWQVDASFCEQHELTLYYKATSSDSYSYVNLDSVTTCEQMNVLLYATSGSIEIIPVVRTNASQINVPQDSCIYVNLINIVTFGIPEFRVDRPAVSDVFQISDGIRINWNDFTPASGLIEYYNIYMFPVYALKFNGGSCNNINFGTVANNFTFLPTKYIEYGISAPSDEFPFTCPPPTGLSLPYTCNSVLGGTTSVITPIDYSFGISIIVEAVISVPTNIFETVRSYPFNYTSYTISEGMSVVGYQQYTWDAQLCQSLDSFIFLHRSYISNNKESIQELRHSQVFQCSLLVGVDYEVPTDISYFTSYSNYVSEAATIDGNYCLLSYESPETSIATGFEEVPIVELFDFKYLDYDTILVTFQITENFTYPIQIYTIPTAIRSTEYFDESIDACSPVTSPPLPFFLNFVSNSTLIDMNSLECENTTEYTCTSVQSIINIPLKHISTSNEFDIRVVFQNTQRTFSPNFNGPFYPPFNFDLLNIQRRLYTNTTLFTANSIMVEWDIEFYCYPESYINLVWNSNNLVSPERRKRGKSVIIPEITLPCNVGSYVINDLGFETIYTICGYVFFNSTTESFSRSCPTRKIIFSNAFQTSPLLAGIRILDFSTIEVTWNPLQFIDSPYTLLAYPSAYGSFDQPITNSFNTSNVTQTTIFLPPSINDDYFELCLNSSKNLTCSKVTTLETSANISVIPGYSYALALYVESQIQPPYSVLGNGYNISNVLLNQISVSGFNELYTYFFDSLLCTSGVRTVYFYDSQFTSGSPVFDVDMCANDFQVDLNSDFAGLPQPRLAFLFQFTNITYPLTNVISPPDFGIIVDPLLSFLPITASPMIMSVTPPPDLSSNIYQVSWPSVPDIPIPQKFVTYIVFAYPESDLLSKESNLCPTNLTEFPQGFPIYSKESDPLNDYCPAPMPISEFYFCGENTSIGLQLPLLALLNYEISVVATYSGGLKTHSFYYSYYIEAPQNLSSLSLSHQVTPASITITWNTEVSFCSDSRLFFILDSAYIPNYVPCSSGSYTIDSLQPLTTYTLAYVFFFDLSATLLPDIINCISNSPVNLEPFPMTTSFCTPINPCGSVGVCSEGFQNSSYHCECSIGYGFDGNTCSDINECLMMPSACTNGACLNNLGSFTCTCFQGYLAISETLCTDIDECQIQSTCVNGNCTNLLSPENFICDCNAGFEGLSCTIPIGTPTCPSISEVTTLSINNVTFPVTEYGVISIVPCSQLDTTLFGNITRQCLDTGEWGPINVDNCQRNIFVAAEELTSESETRILTPMESVTLTETLVTATQESMGILFPGEISVAAVGVSAITESLANLSGDALRENLEMIQTSVVEITSNVLRIENSAAFDSTTQSEAQTYVNNLVDGIQNLGILIGSVAEENATIVIEIEQPTVALIVTLERGRVEPLVLGSNLSMPVGDNTSAVMAAQTSVVIPASIFPLDETIAVSVALFSTIQELVSDVFVNDTSEPGSNLVVEDILASAITSINLFTRDGVRITVLTDEISITYVLNSTEIERNSGPGTQTRIRCASARVLSEGWGFQYVTLANSDDVPSEPAICVATHLTHFGVLVSVTTIPLTDAARLALEILTYLTCGISIIFLLLSIAAYLLLWWKTRKQKLNLFQKDATILHLNFAVSLLLALTFFLLSDAAYSNEGACKAFTIFQYYFWLSVFTSSLSIGIYLLIKIFAWSSQRRFWFYLVLLSWTLPLPLIIITPAAARDNLINTSEGVCFLSQAPSYSNLAFIVPMLVISITNLVILIITAVVLFRISKGNKSILQQIRGVLIASFILAPILSLPWLFSIVATGTAVIVFIFTILLGLQGTLFALLYPLRTPEIYNYVLKCRDPNASTMFAQTSSTHPSQPAPTTIKFKIKRGERGTTGTASTSLPVSKQPEYELGEITNPDNEGHANDQYEYSATDPLKKSSD
ncbi:hypothetical protein LOD99_12552 [Oopsacas minuta]|uniref:Uncharacterized protein n=1 Tax=Oopsacas minuta TaxID=111878 RepID=A0AAV7JD82_9METZ|nr:hypothetical protein LOD99_12552 [Oopsacas minuta]